MFLLSGVKSECCGCGACSQVCPRKCIVITPDEDGFLFPVIDRSDCINCHLCEKVCPIEHISYNKEAQQGQILVAAKSKRDEHIMTAASGGAFGEIVRTIRSKDYWLVWGASFDQNLQLSHQYSHDESDMAPLHKSKYVQSKIIDALPTIKKQLAEGKNVLFSGTPCEVAALHNFLKGKNTEHLLCVDLVCHGVPSQTAFDAYCQEEGERFHSKIKEVQFRYKTKTGLSNRWNSRNILLITEDGKQHVQNRYSSRFLRAYHSFLFYRESCHACVFAQQVRQGDVTIADFWGIQRFYNELSADKGVSLIQANTEKGKIIFSQLGELMDIYDVDRNKYLKMSSGAMVKQTPKNKKRDSFLKFFRTHTFCKSVDTYVPRYKEMIKIELIRKLNPEMRVKFKRLLRR